VSSKEIPQNSVSGQRAAWLRPAKEGTIVGLLFTAVGPAAFGIIGFCLCLHWEAEYNRKVEMVRRGDVKPEMLRIMKIDNGSESTVSLGKFGTAVAWRSVANVEGLRVGDKVDAYRFGDSYFIPRFDNGSFVGKWYFLMFGVGMGAFVGVLGAFRLRRYNRSAAARRSNSCEPSSSVPPRAFSRPSMSFDHNPADTELVALLGEPAHGLVSLSEEGGVLVARPWVLPMKWIVIWLFFVAVGLTCFMCVDLCWEHEGRMNPSDVYFFGLCLLLMWLVVVPGILLVLAFIRRTLAKRAEQRDFFKVDTSRRTLELCPVGRTFKAGEIIAFTVVARWYRNVNMANEWKGALQTGVLVRASNNRVEHYPLIHGWSETTLSSKRSKCADRLAGIFCVPVRRIELNKFESCALNDC
jgi:hypothetical protein